LRYPARNDARERIARPERIIIDLIWIFSAAHKNLFADALQWRRFGRSGIEMAGGATRFRFLDGLRGWAAVTVLFHHIFIDGLPPDSLMADRMIWARAFFLNGTMAVCIFFVVSGFSLSIRYLETGDERGLARIAFGRYFRLAIPIFTICAITYLLMVSGMIPPAGQRPPPLNEYLQFAPDAGGLFSFSLLKVFVAYADTETYDPPLWTMSYEFSGSFMVFAILAIMRAGRLRTVVFGVLFLALALWQSFYALFVGGILLADIFRQGVFRHSGMAKRVNLIGGALCCGGIILSLVLKPWFGLPYIGSAMLLVAGVAFCGPVREFFESRLSEFLGRISYPLYLVQAAVIYAFSLWMLDALSGAGFGSAAQRWIVDIATLPVAFVAAIAFGPANELAVTVSRTFGRACVSFFGRLGERWAKEQAGP
jgi:peptidoglycan/LPS O-acetylase OafA/YrhL